MLEKKASIFDGYAGLKKHFVDKRYPSIVGEDIPDTATNAFKNWFKKRYKMIQYSPEPTARMKEWLRNKESTDTKALGQSSVSLSSSSSQTTTCLLKTLRPPFIRPLKKLRPPLRCQLWIINIGLLLKKKVCAVCVIRKFIKKCTECLKEPDMCTHPASGKINSKNLNDDY